MTVPAFAYYAAEKPIPENASCLLAVRRECVSKLQSSRNARVTVLGLRPPVPNDPDDDNVLSCLLETLRDHAGAKCYLSVDPKDCEAANAYGLAADTASFDDFVASR